MFTFYPHIVDIKKEKKNYNNRILINPLALRNMNKIRENRKQIDEIDDKIIELLNKRADLTKKIGELKKSMNLDIFQPEREKEIVERIKKQSQILKDSHITAIWKEIMGACKDIQGAILSVGYLGPKGTFTHQAALNFFSKSGTEFTPCKTILEIFENIEKDIFDFGVIPIENSLHGTVRETLDLLIEKEICIYGEVELRIIQNLIGFQETQLPDIKKIISHPQAFAQTRSWIKKNLPKAELIEASSTAEAVRKIQELNDISYAALGTEFAAKVYDLKVLYSKIEDEPSNYTRFLVISKNENPLKTENMKTSVVYVTKHVPGALYSVLKIFSDLEINLLKIESRPSRKGRWEYIFLMDFEGDKDKPNAKEALALMKSNVIWYKILGSYPMK